MNKALIRVAHLENYLHYWWVLRVTSNFLTTRDMSFQALPYLFEPILITIHLVDSHQKSILHLSQGIVWSYCFCCSKKNRVNKQEASYIKFFDPIVYYIHSYVHTYLYTAKANMGYIKMSYIFRGFVNVFHLI